MKAYPPPGSRVVFYLRYSSSLQNYKSIEGQDLVCTAEAKKRGWVVVGRYADAERSGTTTVGREHLFRMMADGELGKFDVVLFEELDRASRDAADTFQIAKNLQLR